MGRGSKTRKIVLEEYGSYLSLSKGCFVVRNKDRESENIPVLEMDLGEIVLKEGSVVTTGALAYCGMWGVDVLITTRFGEPIAMLKNFYDDCFVKTRISQYESLKDGKALYLAKQFLIGKILGQNIILNKYGLERCLNYIPTIQNLSETNLIRLRNRLTSIEGKHSRYYFKEVYKLFNEKVRPLSRVSYHAYVGLNNVFNLGYTLLKWKCYRAIVKAHLEPYLGYLHTHLVPYRPNLVCDFMELYRYLIDDFLIRNCRDLTVKDFYPKKVIIGNRKAKRMFLKDEIASSLVNSLNEYFTEIVRIPRIKRGKQQELETLINEEAMLLGKYLRDERDSWIPRVVRL